MTTERSRAARAVCIRQGPSFDTIPVCGRGKTAAGDFVTCGRSDGKFRKETLTARRSGRAKKSAHRATTKPTPVQKRTSWVKAPGQPGRRRLATQARKLAAVCR